MFLPITLPNNWDTFDTTITNSTPIGGFVSAIVESGLFIEEVNRKNLYLGKGTSNLVTRGRSSSREKSSKRSQILVPRRILSTIIAGIWAL